MGLEATSGIQQDLNVFTSFSCFEATLTPGLRVNYIPTSCGSPTPTPTATVDPDGNSYCNSNTNGDSRRISNGHGTRQRQLQLRLSRRGLRRRLGLVPRRRLARRIGD